MLRGTSSFFKEQLGPRFSFNVAFQNWLKKNAGKTYQEALLAYQEILTQKKKQPTTIGKQFEYNAYIRDFFVANSERKLTEAIDDCWKAKKVQPGPNVYAPEDLAALSGGGG